MGRGLEIKENVSLRHWSPEWLNLVWFSEYVAADAAVGRETSFLF